MPQSLAHILIHVVFSTKNRIPHLSDNVVRADLHKMLATSFNDHESPAIIIGGTADHVHALIHLGRAQSFSRTIGEAKRISSVWVSQNHVRDFAWQAGYSAFSVSASIAPRVIEYIRTQEKHHARRSYQDEVRDLLTKHGVAFDERYLWD